MAHHSTSTSMHVNPVAQNYKQQAEGEDKRLIERGELKRCRPSTLIDGWSHPAAFRLTSLIRLFDLQEDRITRTIAEIELQVVIVR